MIKTDKQFFLKLTFRSLIIRCIACIGIVSVMPFQAKAVENENVLSLKEAVSAAQQNDPWLVQNRHSQSAVESMSVAEGTLPDPKMSLALANLPTDTFDFTQEPMTQLKVGIAQMFPRGDTLALKRHRLELLGLQFPYQRQDRRAKTAVMVGNLWLEAYKAQESITLIEEDRPLFEQLSDIAEASYSAALGRTRQQDIIRAQLELSRLEDRLTSLKQKKEVAIESLSEWLSDSFREEYLVDQSKGSMGALWRKISLQRDLPDITMLERPLYTSDSEIDPQILYEHFSRHPSVKALEQKIKASTTGIELAQQKYKPEWGVNAAYSYREEDRNGNDLADFFSVGVTFDLPLFTKNRQDKQVESAMSGAHSVKTEKWLLVRKMIADFEKSRARLNRLEERRKRYEREILPQMHEQAEASLTAYTNDDGDFAEVVRARIAELNANIEMLGLNVEKQQTIINLNYYFMADADAIIAGYHDAGEEK